MSCICPFPLSDDLSIFSQVSAHSCRRQRQLRKSQSPSFRNRALSHFLSPIFAYLLEYSLAKLQPLYHGNEGKCPPVERRNCSRPLTAHTVRSPNFFIYMCCKLKAMQLSFVQILFQSEPRQIQMSKANYCYD